MQKIISLFQRNYDGDRLVRDKVVPGAEWVLGGEGVATWKLDGMCCLVRGGRLYKRYDAKKGKTPPAGFEPAQAEPDPVTGHWPGWLLVGGGPEDRWHREAFSAEVEAGRLLGRTALPDGTYELVGPKIQGNPEGYVRPALVSHRDPSLVFYDQPPRNFEGIREWLRPRNVEGIVWHHPDGRMVKIKKKDFGLFRGGLRSPAGAE